MSGAQGRDNGCGVELGPLRAGVGVVDRKELGGFGLAEVLKLVGGRVPEGDPMTVGHHAWTLSEEKSRPFFQQALNTVKREDVVVATKVQ